MAEVGVRDVDLPRRDAVDLVRAIVTVDGIEESVLQEVPKLAQQLLASGPIADKLEETQDSYHGSVELAEDLDAEVGTTPGLVARVFGEPDDEHNGVFKRGLVVWTRIGPLPGTNLSAIALKQDRSDNLDQWTTIEPVVYPAAGDQVIPGVHRDPVGFIAASDIYTRQDGTVVMPTLEIVPSDKPRPFFAVDGVGFVIEIEEAPVPGDGGMSFAAEERLIFLAQDARGQAYSAAVPNRKLPPFQGLTRDFNLGMDDGQSRSNGGAGGRPSTMEVPGLGVNPVMVGTSVRPSDESNTFVPFGDAVLGDSGISVGDFELRPLVATCDIDNPGGGHRYDVDTEVVSPTAGRNGEAPIVGAIYELLARINVSRNEEAGDWMLRILIGTCLGYGGQRIMDLLSDDNLPSHPFSAWLRKVDFLDKLVAHIPDEYPGKTLGWTWWEWIQGEADAALLSTPEMKAQLAILKERMDALAITKFGQAKPPLMMLPQVMQHWVRGRPAIPQAHLEFVKENRDRGVYMPTQTFAVPGKFQVPVAPGFVALPSSTDMSSVTLNEHLPGPATLWLAAYIGKLLWKLLWKGENWEEMHILEATRRRGSKRICVTWHTPVAPIAVAACFIGYRLRFMPDNGVQIFYAGIQRSINSVEFLRQSIIFDLDLVPPDGSQIDIHLGMAEGRHNIRDSDPDVSTFTYEPSHQDFAAFDPDPDNMTAGEILVNNEVNAELGHLFHKPFPLPNWAAGEVFRVTEIA